MAGYSEVIQTMAAMVIFSLVLINANRMILRNNIMMVEGELEQETVALAQDILEEARTKEFDENSMGNLPPAKIPDSLSSSYHLGPDAGETKRTDFDDFDDYNGWQDSVLTEHGYYNIHSEVFYVTSSNFDSTGARSTFKKLRVYITSDYLKKHNTDELKQYYFEFIRNYYAD